MRFLRHIIIIASSLLLHDASTIGGSATFDARSVIELNDDNFYWELKQRRLAIVAFYAPWCDHFDHLYSEFLRAAEMINASDTKPSIMFAIVDATENDKLADWEHIEYYPELKLYNRGTFSEVYPGASDANGMVKFLKWYNQFLYAVRKPSSAEEIARWIQDAKDTIVLGAYESGSSEGFGKLAKKLSMDYAFAICTFEIVPLDALGLDEEPSEDTVYVIKSQRYKSKGEMPMVRAFNNLDEKVLISNIFQNNLPLVGEVNGLTRGRYYDMDKPLVTVHFHLNASPSRTRYVSNRLRSMAMEKEGKDGTMLSDLFLFGVAHMEELRHFDTSRDSHSGDDTSEFAVTVDFKGELLRSLKGTKAFEPDALNRWLRDMFEDIEARTYDLKSLGQDTFSPSLSRKKRRRRSFDDVAKVHHRPGHVLVLTGDTFRDVVYDADRVVFLVISEPWCRHCEGLNDMLSELATSYADTDDVVIATIDSNVHDVPAAYDHDVLPALYLRSGSEFERYFGLKEMREVQASIKPMVDKLKRRREKGNKKKKRRG